MAKAQQALASARTLLAAGDADGACNRAYYAVFDAARAALLTVGEPVGKTHRGVLTAFSERLVKTGALPKDVGRWLKQAEAARYVADYEDHSVAPAEAERLVAQADAVLAAVRALVTRQA